MSTLKRTAPKQLVMFSPSGALVDETLLDRACSHLSAQHGFSVTEMPEARLRVQRFAGNESERITSIENAFAINTPSLLMATRGGYGLSRLLPQLNFPKLASLLNSNAHQLCGHSDITSLQLALLNAGAKPFTLLHGPMACFDFGAEQGADPVTVEHFLRAVNKQAVDIQWPVEGFGFCKQQNIEGQVWGGNLTLLCSLLGTPWLPNIPGGILVLEDVNEPAYKIERMLLQLLHAGVLATQQAILLGNFSEPQPGIHDNGFSLRSAAEFVQSELRNQLSGETGTTLKQIPVLMNFPFGHCTPKACWFQGGQGSLTIGPSTAAPSELRARLIQNLQQ
ncbi:MAG: LD-carboxypeptidase [Burkholderiales bacterium]|uniref:LD-carboxypeptidase n=1 Tax=Limnobacter sp. TaxID=2003368 RepID=UPI0039BCF5E0|nr:LD-carboxypeptidase [Burkholderiales bacterium]